MRASSSGRQYRPHHTERKRLIERIQKTKHMTGRNRYGPCAKAMALRITVLGNGRGMLSWLAVGNHSLSDGNQESKCNTSVNTEQMKRRPRNKQHQHFQEGIDKPIKQKRIERIIIVKEGCNK
jgi:hypothetical protein